MEGDRGREIAGYRIESEIGRGGMGVVYLATQAFPERRVALKLLSPDLASDSSFRERFVRESNAAASIEHPSIVPVYGAGESDGQLYLAMRYVEGTDLHSLLAREGRLPPERATKICRQVAEALEAAHERGLVHRDVKPANVLIDASDRAYLSDFGLIRQTRIETELTKTGQFMGTIDYVAPEQIRGEHVDGRADVYSLGCVLYECLTGVPPFARDSEVATIYGHLQDAPPRPSADAKDVSPQLDGVVQRAMAKRADDRFATAGAMAEALRGPAGPAGSAPRRTRTGIVVGIALAALIALVVGLVVLNRGSDGGVPASPSLTGSTIPLNSLVQIDPETGAVLETVTGMPAPGNRFPNQVEIGEGGVWVLAGGSIVHVDPSDGGVVGVVTVGLDASSIAVGGRMVWVGTARGIERINPVNDEKLRPVNLESLTYGGSHWLAFGSSRTWALSTAGTVTGLDPATAQETGSVDLSSVGSGLGVGFDGVWVLDNVAGTLINADPENLDDRRTVEIPEPMDRIAVGARGVWILDSAAGLVIPVDPVSLAVGAPIRVGSEPTDIAVGLDAIWVTNQGDETISKIDPIAETVETINVGAPVAAIAVDEASGSLWVDIAPSVVYGSF